MDRTISHAHLKFPALRRLIRPFKWLTPFFGRLQWKLTLAYSLFTVITVLILGGVAVGVLWYSSYRSGSLPNRVAEGLQKANFVLAPYLSQSPPDQAGLQQWLNTAMHGDELVIPLPNEYSDDESDTMVAQFGKVVTLAIVDRQGQIVAAYPPDQISTGDALAGYLTPDSQPLLATALAGQTETEPLSRRGEEGEIIAAAPLFDQTEQLVGAIYLASTLPIDESEFVQIVFQGTVLPAAVGMLVVGLIAGVLFGFLISRGLTRRLTRLTQATDDWSRGNFNTLALDPSGDELGLLARHMNHMAIQLQNLLQTRQELATLEERNRLARDLHDSVKQQVFATAMQIGASKALIEQHPQQAQTHLLEAEQLIRQAQQELTTLIRELRPAALEGKGLAQAVRDCAADWSRQTGIEAEVRVRGERPLPLPIEQSLFRVAQEGLANVARHSGASAVEIELAWNPDGLKLAISDNGQGFNVSQPRDHGVGLRSMRERVEAIGGALTVESHPGQGTRITAELANIT